MKKIFKYATGDVIPEGAIYLGTVTQTRQDIGDYDTRWVDCWLVWHYFLVEVKK